MKKLSEYQDEEAIEVLGDLMEPAMTIFSDKEIAEGLQGKDRMKAVRMILKTYSKEVKEILAALDRTPVEEYHCNVMTLPTKLLEIMNDKELMSFFGLAAETDGETTSGSVMENTEAVAK